MLYLTKARRNIGAAVIYSDPHPGGFDSEGIIHRVNEEYIFISFKKDNGEFSMPMACSTWQLTLTKEWNDKKRWQGIVND